MSGITVAGGVTTVDVSLEELARESKRFFTFADYIFEHYPTQEDRGDLKKQINTVLQYIADNNQESRKNHILLGQLKSLNDIIDTILSEGDRHGEEQIALGLALLLHLLGEQSPTIHQILVSVQSGVDQDLIAE